MEKTTMNVQELSAQNPHNHIELYFGHATNRFATFTGNAINDHDLMEGTTACLTTLDKDMRRKVNYSSKHDGDTQTDEVGFDIFSSLRKQKNDKKFVTLYDKGGWQSLGYSSQSEVDAGLYSMLAFHTEPDPEAIDRLFRGSALYQPKWDRDDYKASTIDLGIESCHGQFHKSKMDRLYFIKFNDSGKSYISVPLLAKYVRRPTDYILVRDNGMQTLHKYIYEDGCFREVVKFLRRKPFC